MYVHMSLFWVYFNIHIRNSCLPDEFTFQQVLSYTWGSAEFTCVTTPAKYSNTDKQLTHTHFKVMWWLSVIVSFVCPSLCVSTKSPPADPYPGMQRHVFWQGSAQWISGFKPQPCHCGLFMFPVWVWVFPHILFSRFKDTQPRPTIDSIRSADLS